VTQDFGGPRVKPKKRREGVRHVRTYLLVGPPAGFTSVLLLMTATAGSRPEGLGLPLLILLVGLPFSYVLGAVPALITGLVTLKLRWWPKPLYVLAATGVGAVASGVSGDLLIRATSPANANVGSVVVLSLVGAIAALVCALMTMRRPNSGDADVAAVFE
jgi:hypothetical protein